MPAPKEQYPPERVELGEPRVVHGCLVRDVYFDNAFVGEAIHSRAPGAKWRFEPDALSGMGSRSYTLPVDDTDTEALRARLAPMIGCLRA